LLAARTKKDRTRSRWPARSAIIRYNRLAIWKRTFIVFLDLDISSYRVGRTCADQHLMSVTH